MLQRNLPAQVEARISPRRRISVLLCSEFICWHRFTSMKPFLPILSILTAIFFTSGLQAAPKKSASIAITIAPGARQPFAGLGTSIGNWGGDYQKLTPGERARLSRFVFGGLKLKSLRLWLNLNEYAPVRGARLSAGFRARYIDSGLITDARKNGVVNLLLAPDNAPDYLKIKREGGAADFAIPDENIAEYCALIAEFIRQIRDETGVLIGVTGLQNEPNDLDRIAPAQFVAFVVHLRAELDKRGLGAVQIIAPESANVDGVFYEALDALKFDSQAWRALSGIASHSYNMAATERAARYVVGSGKSYWMTEASANGPETPGDMLQAASLASRFLSDMNHGVTHWIHFLGFETPDPRDNATRIIAYTPGPLQTTVFQKYFSYRQLSNAFDVGAVFRQSQSSLEGEMTWTYGPKPRLTVAAARNSDGSWALGISNFTAPGFSVAPNDDGYANGFAAQTFDVKIEVPELSKIKTLPFRVTRSGAKNGVQKPIEMKNGVLTIPNIAPLELVTLRSILAK